MDRDNLSSVFAALADPTRRAILSRLKTSEVPVKELMKPFEMSAPAITKHLKVLERAGLISRSREAQWRPCRIEATPLKEVSEWVESYRKFWEGSLDRLGDLLQELKASEKLTAKAPKNLKEKKYVGTAKRKRK
jgi:DNA-binding transcriptional ArsR family regulator